MPKVNRELNYKKYLETLEESTCATVSVNSKRSKNHQIYSISQVKLALTALSSYCKRRYFLDRSEGVVFVRGRGEGGRRD